MVGCFTALALGQLLIGWVPLEGAAPFNLVIVLFAIALVLVTTTRAEAPQIVAADYLPFGVLSREAPVAVAGALLSGFITGAFYALVPAWMQDENIDPQTIGFFMLSALGGLAFQIPVGRVSDRFDLRIVIAVLGGCLTATAIGLLKLPQTPSMLYQATRLAPISGTFDILAPQAAPLAHEAAGNAETQP